MAKETVQISKTVALPVELMETIKQEARTKGWNVSTLINDLLRSYLRASDP